MADWHMVVVQMRADLAAIRSDLAAIKCHMAQSTIHLAGSIVVSRDTPNLTQLITIMIVLNTLIALAVLSFRDDQG